MLKRLITISYFLLIILTIYVSCSEKSMKNKNLNFNKLSIDEEKIIVYKGTEAPFSGEYNTFFKDGSYHCKRCNALLFHSSDKFASTCGWPSFDDEVKGAIKRVPDSDGIRTEILCANCGAHLGHIFTGEHLTNKNVRYCVNSLSLSFIPKKKSENIANAYFAGGCFWGMEYLFEHKKGIISAVSGYMGGTVKNPSYKMVCKGNTGYLETVKVSYNTNVINYEDLAKFFFEIHDPTQQNGQGPDIGEQYHSAIFYNNDTEKKIAGKLIKILKAKGFNVVTKILPVSTFWEAEEYHQNYYDRKKQKPYCHFYQKKF